MPVADGGSTAPEAKRDGGLGGDESDGVDGFKCDGKIYQPFHALSRRINLSALNKIKESHQYQKLF